MIDAIGNDRLVLYAIPMFLVLVLLEAGVSAWRHRGWYQREDAIGSLGMGVGNVLISVSLKGGWLALYALVYEYRLFELDTRSAWVWVVGLFLQDFCFYWYHRSSHRVRLLWAAHEAHHSSAYCNFTTALRQSWLSPLYSYAFFLPMALLGFHPLLIITTQSISLIYQFFLHTEAVGRLGAVEWVMNTPSHHRAHHGRNPQYIDINYAGIFIIWDRMFGTFVPENEKVQFGLTKDMPDHNPFRIAVNQLLMIRRDLSQARTVRDVLGILFRGPEWWSEAQSRRTAAGQAESGGQPISAA